MTHNEFDFYEDLIKPANQFLAQFCIVETHNLGNQLRFDEKFFIPPKV